MDRNHPENERDLTRGPGGERIPEGGAGREHVGHDRLGHEHVGHDRVGHEHGRTEPGYVAGAHTEPGYVDHGAAPVQQKGGAGMGIAALVLGILALLTAWIPGINFVSVVLAIAAIVLGFIAHSRAKKINGSGRGLGIAGIVLGVLSILLAALVWFGLMSFLNTDDGKCLKDAGGDQSKIDQCTEKMVNSN